MMEEEFLKACRGGKTTSWHTVPRGLNGFNCLGRPKQCISLYPKQHVNMAVAQ